MTSNGNRAGAIAVAVVAAGMLIVGLNTLAHIDYCGNNVMAHGEMCPNTGGHSRRSWLNDYDDQRARNQRVGTSMTAGSGVMFLAAGLIWAYGTVNVFRIIFRRSTGEQGPSGNDFTGRG